MALRDTAMAQCSLFVLKVPSSPSPVIVLEKDNYPILNSCSLKTVSSIDVYLNLDDCILHYSPVCSPNFVRIVRLILHFLHKFYIYFV